MASTFQPLQYLPPKLARYSSFPWGLLLCWVTFVVALSLVPAPTGIPNSSVSGLTEVAVRGSESFKLIHGENKLFVTGGPLDGDTVEWEKNGEHSVFNVKKGDEVLARGVAAGGSADNITLFAGNGDLKYQIAGDEDGFKVKRADGQKIARVKIKEEKFNIYNADDVRTLKGKPKNGSFVVRTEGDSQVATMSFSSATSDSDQLLVGGILFLPIELEYRLLILAAKAPANYQ